MLTIFLSYSITLAADRGTISGRVQWDGGYGFVPDAKIYVYDLDENLVDSALTGETGYFRLEIPAGNYLVSAEKGNLVREYYPGEYFGKDANRVTVYGGQNITLNFDLDSGGWISGNFGFVGDGVDFGLVTALKVDEPNEGWFKSLRLDGPFPSSYAISGLLPGAYKVLGRARGKSTEYYPGVEEIEDASTLLVVGDVGVSDVEFMLDQVGWGSVLGRVYDLGTGEGIAGITLYAYQWQNFWEDPNLITAQSQCDGSYSVNLPAGEYSLLAVYDDDANGGSVAQYYDNRYSPMFADIIAVSENSYIQNIDFAIDYSIPHNLSITGNISSQRTGYGLNDVNVEALDYETGEIVGSAYTVNDGEFIVNGLSPGNYLLMFSGTYIIPFFYPQAESWEDGEIIRLQSHFTGVRTEAITQDYGNMGLLISGIVTSNGDPVNGARVYAYLLGDNEPIAFARTNSQGEYAIVNGLIPGTYIVMCDFYGCFSNIFPLPIVLNLLHQPHAENIDFELQIAVGVDEKPILPDVAIDIMGNYPNPFNSGTIISLYSGREDEFNAQLVVYNVLGQEVGHKWVILRPGQNLIEWDLGDFSSETTSGIYFYRVNGTALESRMILLK